MPLFDFLFTAAVLASGEFFFEVDAPPVHSFGFHWPDIAGLLGFSPRSRGFPPPRGAEIC